MAKVHVTRLVLATMDKAVEVHGGILYSEDRWNDIRENQDPFFFG